MKIQPDGRAAPTRSRTPPLNVHPAPTGEPPTDHGRPFQTGPKVPCQLTERVFINMSPNTRSKQSKHSSYLFNAKQSPDFAFKNKIQNQLTLEKRLYGPVQLHGNCDIHVFSNTNINSPRTIIELNIPQQTSFSHLHLIYEGLQIHKLHIVIFDWLTPTCHALPVPTNLLI